MSRGGKKAAAASKKAELEIGGNIVHIGPNNKQYTQAQLEELNAKNFKEICKGKRTLNCKFFVPRDQARKYFSTPFPDVGEIQVCNTSSTYIC